MILHWPDLRIAHPATALYVVKDPYRWPVHVRLVGGIPVAYPADPTLLPPLSRLSAAPQGLLVAAPSGRLSEPEKASVAGLLAPYLAPGALEALDSPLPPRLR